MNVIDTPSEQYLSSHQTRDETALLGKWPDTIVSGNVFGSLEFSRDQYIKRIDVIDRYLKICGTYGITDTKSELSVKILKNRDHILNDINSIKPDIKSHFSNFEVNLKTIKISYESILTILKNMLDACNVCYRIIHRNDGNYMHLKNKDDIFENYNSIYSTYKGYHQCAYENLFEKFRDFKHDDIITCSGNFSELVDKNGKTFGYGIKDLNLIDYDFLDIDINNVLNMPIDVELTINGQQLMSKTLNANSVNQFSLKSIIPFIPYLMYMRVEISISFSSCLKINKNEIHNITYNAPYGKRPIYGDKKNTEDSKDTMIALPLLAMNSTLIYNQLLCCDGMATIKYST